MIPRTETTGGGTKHQIDPPHLTALIPPDKPSSKQSRGDYGKLEPKVGSRIPGLAQGRPAPWRGIASRSLSDADRLDSADGSAQIVRTGGCRPERVATARRAEVLGEAKEDRRVYVFVECFPVELTPLIDLDRVPLLRRPFGQSPRVGQRTRNDKTRCEPNLYRRIADDDLDRTQIVGLG